MGITVGLALLALALLLVMFALRLRSRTGLPWTPVTFSDTAGQILEKPLVARQLGLTGKPDYLLELRGCTIPVEVKPGRRARVPYESDLMQLAAYCVLLEETTGEPPPFGLLRYAEQTFRLDYTPHVRADLLALLEEMRADLVVDDCERSHDDVARCRACGFCDICDQSLNHEQA
jgi:CRISPR-associated exonuclease Cas4